MKIGIDIDDTLTNTKNLQKKCWRSFVRSNPNPNFTEELPSIINEFGNDYIQLFWDTYREPLSFKSSYKANCSEVINKLIKDGHELCIITSRPKERYKNLIKDIQTSLTKQNIPITTIYTNILHKGIFCKENNIDLLIDDSIKQISEANDNNIKTILFNKLPNYKGLKTTTWNKLYLIIKKMNNN